MFNLKSLLLPLVTWLCMLIIPASAKPTSADITIADFVKRPQAKDAVLSPDGKHIAVVFRQKGEYRLAILDAKTRQSIGIYGIKGDGEQVGKVYWVNNKRVVYSVLKSYAWDEDEIDSGELVGLNIDGSKHVFIFGYRSHRNRGNNKVRKYLGEYGSHRILDTLPGDDKHILLAFYPWRDKGRYWVPSRSTAPTVFKVNVYNGEPDKVDSLPMPLADAIVDNRGNLRFAIGTTDDNTPVIWYKEKPGDHWAKWSLPEFEGKRITPLSFAENDHQVYLGANVGEGTRALYSLDLKTNLVEKLIHDENVDISRLVYDFAGRRVVAASTELALPQYHYIDAKDPKAQLQQFLLASFPGFDTVITSHSDSHDKAIVYVYSDTHPGMYLLYRRDSNQFETIMAARQWIDHRLMAPMAAVGINTRDGSAIAGYLTQPPNKKGPHPMVVLPHGGPHGSRDYWGFDWEAQLLASRGYAVLQVNFRGSDGFGLAFEQSGKGQWGGLMQDDLTDATRAMIERGIANPKRICMYGGSYGAYASVMGAVREPDLYRCVIGSAGVYHLPMMYEKGDIAGSESGLSYLKQTLGEDLADLKRRSPAFNAGKIKAPVLLIHGSQDDRAPIEQAESMADALKKAGKSYRLTEIDKEPHGYYNEKNREKIYREILKFLEQHLSKP